MNGGCNLCYFYKDTTVRDGDRSRLTGISGVRKEGKENGMQDVRRCLTSLTSRFHVALPIVPRARTDQYGLVLPP